MSEKDRQNTLKSHFSSYKGNSNTGKQYDGAQTGSDKLAAFKDGSGSSSSNTPSVKETTDDEMKANMLISDSVDRSKGINRAKEALEKIQQAKIRETLQRYDRSPLRPDLIKDKLNLPHIDVVQQNKIAGELRSEIVQSQNQQSTIYNPFGKSAEEQLKEAEQKEQQEAMNLGRFEDTASGYESYVANYLSPYTNSNAPVGDRFLAGALEAIVLTPTAIPRVIVGLARNPTATVQAMIQGPVESVIEDPAKGSGQLVGMVLAGKAIDVGLGEVKSSITYIGKEKVPVETLARHEIVSGEVTFPTAKQNTPIPDVIKVFEETGSRYPGEINPAKEYGIHATDVKLPKSDVTRAGSSETPGLYVGPDASLHFTGAMGDAKPKIQLFGLDSKSPTPSINFFEMNSIERLPPNLRDNLVAANEFMVNSAEKGVGYTTVKMESGLKYGARERELVIPENTEFTLKESAYYTEINGKKAPVNMYETVYDSKAPTNNIAETVDRLLGKKKSYSDFMKESESYSNAYQDTYSLITPKKLGYSLMSGVLGSRFANSDKTNGSIPKSQLSVSNYMPNMESVVPDYSRSFPDSSKAYDPTESYNSDYNPFSNYKTTLKPSVVEPTPEPKETKLKSKRRDEKVVDPLSDFGRFNKEWKNPVLSGMDILGYPGRRK